jgi:hypothetical protein
MPFHHTQDVRLHRTRLSFPDIAKRSMSDLLLDQRPEGSRLMLARQPCRQEVYYVICMFVKISDRPKAVNAINFIY